jgi:hypothetical protein
MLLPLALQFLAAITANVSRVTAEVAWRQWPTSGSDQDSLDSFAGGLNATRFHYTPVRSVVPGRSAVVADVMLQRCLF